MQIIIFFIFTYLPVNVMNNLNFFTFTKGVGNYANLPVNVINHLTFFTFTKAVGNYAKLAVYVNNEASFLTFTNTAGNYAKLPVILQNYQFITFTITYIYINDDSSHDLSRPKSSRVKKF